MIEEFTRGFISKEIVYADNSLYDGNKVLFLYASQYLSGFVGIEAYGLDKFELTWYQTPIIYGIPKKIICDNRPFLQLNLRYLSEVQDF